MALSEDIVTRIINVHWADGGVFIAVEITGSNVYYMNTVAEDSKWQSLGDLGFGHAIGSSFATITDAHGNETPTFILVGEDYVEVGLIKLSNDGQTWRKVHSFGNGSESTEPFDTSARVFGVVWVETEKAFYAGAHQSDFGADPDPDDPGIFTIREIDVLLRSVDGLSWSEVGRHEVSWLSTEVAPDYPTGLLAAHCSPLVTDGDGNKVPDGCYGYDKDGENVLIEPSVMTRISYLVGNITSHAPGAGVDVTWLGDLHPDYPEATAFPALCVAFAGGEWLVAGGTLPDFEVPATCRAARLTQVTSPEGDVSFEWASINPSGSSPIVTICGGEV